MMARHNTIIGTSSTSRTRNAVKCDPRAYVYWSPGTSGGLISAIERHRLNTGWGGYIIVRAA